jgi:DNA-binding Xre family transcriptional regulator
MTYEEVMKRVDESALKRDISFKQMSADTGISIKRLQLIFSGQGTRFYTLLDLIDSVGLEMELDGKPMGTHQDVLVYLEDRLYRSELTPFKLSQKMDVKSGTTRNFFDGGNCRADTFFLICDAMGVEVRVV